MAGLVVVVGAPKEVDPERGQSGRLAGLDAVGARPHSRSASLARQGLSHSKAYVWSSVLAYNLALFVRLRPT